jgi:hypothetical protein
MRRLSLSEPSMKIALAAASLILAAAPSVASADDQYLDDRSDAASLVRSLYNAVNRKEYARAWDYYGDQKPAKTYDKFVQGYAKTDHVEVATGAISEEGAAGSLFYQVAVAIRATDADGNENTFAGCYTARLAQPAVQEPPFKPMHIEKGALKPASSDGPLSDALPASCGDAPPSKADATVAKIVQAFKATYGDTCQTLAADAEPGAADPDVHELKFKLDYETDQDPEHVGKLVKFDCGMGAYNSNEVYYFTSDIGDGFTPLQFAEPELDIKYEDPDPDQQTKVKSMDIIGYTTTDQLVNSDYDEQDKSITSFSKWRGVGDASSTGKYIFRNGRFTLVHYDVDATYDGEENPKPVIDLDTAP